jgi:SAM-dependent methyltransferase
MGHQKKKHLSQQQIISVNKAVSLCDTNEHKQARKLALKILNKVPDDDSAEFVIALCDEAIGDLTKAIHYCRRAVKHAAGFRNYEMKLASLLLHTNQLVEAEQLFTELLQADPEDPNPLRGLSLISESRGDPAMAYHFLVKVKHLNALSSSDQFRIAENISNFTILPNSPDFEENLCNVLDYDNINISYLSNTVCRYLVRKYNMEEEDTVVNLATLVSDQLLLKTLKSMVVVKPEIEHLLTQLRLTILNEIATQQTIANQILPLIVALALQNHINEFVFLISDDEKQIIDLFCQLLTTQSSEHDWTPAQSELTLLCLSMYGRLYEQANRDRFLQHPITAWPNSLTMIANTSLYEIAQEIELAAKIDSISLVDDETSQAVRAQYESNPYPRWVRPEHGMPETFSEYMTAALPSYTAPKRLRQPDIDILVAGCGTGNEPIKYSLALKQAHITAVDISRCSLAYAKRKAKEFDASNIDFFHGDILHLDQLDQRFDLILSSGVIHHMANPLKGWKILRDLLATDGVLELSLYSQIARREISLQRKAIEALGIKPEPDQIRRYRHTLIGANLDTSIPTFRDFWSLSECRDLLFHCEEHQFTWLQIERSLEQLNMELIGLHAEKNVHQLYQSSFPTDPQGCDLKNWHLLECNHPNLFMGMYSFWCRKKQRPSARK